MADFEHANGKDNPSQGGIGRRIRANQACNASKQGEEACLTYRLKA